MAGLVPVFIEKEKLVDARHKAGHDEIRIQAAEISKSAITGT